MSLPIEFWLHLYSSGASSRSKPYTVPHTTIRLYFFNWLFINLTSLYDIQTASYSIQIVSACDSFLIHSPHDLSQAFLNSIHVHCSPGIYSKYILYKHSYIHESIQKNHAIIHYGVL